MLATSNVQSYWVDLHEPNLLGTVMTSSSGMLCRHTITYVDLHYPLGACVYAVSIDYGGNPSLGLLKINREHAAICYGKQMRSRIASAWLVVWKCEVEACNKL